MNIEQYNTYQYDPGEGYRWLSHGEIIIPGDEVVDENGCASLSKMVGAKVGDEGSAKGYRRYIQKWRDENIDDILREIKKATHNGKNTIVWCGINVSEIQELIDLGYTITPKDISKTPRMDLISWGDRGSKPYEIPKISPRELDI